MKTPDYLSYDRYKKKKDANPNRRMLIFITTFFVMLLFFTAIVKALSPNVDVTIGDESQTDAKETGLGVKRFIDDRLKSIQMEDNSNGMVAGESNKKSKEYVIQDREQYARDVEEKIELPSKKNRTDIGLDEDAMYPQAVKPTSNARSQATKSTVTAPPRPSRKDLSTPFESPRVSKVYVGRYSTIEQAKVAQEILMDSGLNISPFVKDVGGYYTLQVGSYTSRAKADGVASELQRNSFPARVIQE